MAEDPPISLREFEIRIAELDKRFSQRFQAQETAILKAEAANEKRFEGVNEFRKTLSDQTASLMTRTEALSKFEAMGDKISLLQGRLDRAGGGGEGLRAGLSVLLAVIAIAVSLYAALKD